MKFRVYYKRTLFSITLTIVAATANLQAQANNSISGFVFGIDRQPVSEVGVELSDENYRFISRVRTDGGGRFSFFRLSQGRYYVKVLPIGTGYEEQTRDTEIVNITRQSGGRPTTFGSDSVQMNFYLKPHRDSANAPLLTGVVFAQAVPKAAQKLYESAISDLGNKQIDKGITELQSAVAIFADYYLALERLGVEWVNQRKFAEAREVLAKAVKVNPRGFECVYSLGYSLHNLGRYSEAIDTLNKAVELNPSSVNGWYVLGLGLRHLGKYKEAANSLKKAEKLNPAISDVHWQLALLYTNDLKDYAAAIDELDLFLKTNPRFDEAEKVRDLIRKLREKVKV